MRNPWVWILGLGGLAAWLVMRQKSAVISAPALTAAQKTVAIVPGETLKPLTDWIPYTNQSEIPAPPEEYRIQTNHETFFNASEFYKAQLQGLGVFSSLLTQNSKYRYVPTNWPKGYTGNSVTIQQAVGK